MVLRPAAQINLTPSGFASSPAPCKAPGKAEEDGPIAWAPATQLGDPDGEPGSWRSSGSGPALAAAWGTEASSVTLSFTHINSVSQKEQVASFPIAVQRKMHGYVDMGVDGRVDTGVGGHAHMDMESQVEVGRDRGLAAGAMASGPVRTLPGLSVGILPRVPGQDPWNAGVCRGEGGLERDLPGSCAALFWAEEF